MITFIDDDVFIPKEWTFEVAPAGMKPGIGLAQGRI